jgi:hypothetical protein
MSTSHIEYFGIFRHLHLRKNIFPYFEFSSHRCVQKEESADQQKETINQKPENPNMGLVNTILEINKTRPIKV